MKRQEKDPPRHIAIIMDGNGRWAQARNLPRTEGHRIGAGRVRDIVYACLELGVRYLTIYAFSKENWKRPGNEVRGIMGLARFFFRRFFDELKKEGVFFVHLGDTEGLSPGILKIIRNMEEHNAAERKLYLNIAFNYSGRSEITRAVREISSLVEKGGVTPSDITEELVNRHLYTAKIPDPDLVIRTGGEHRVSNFLLWQIAYSEIWVTDTLWPDFTKQTLIEAIEEYHKRERRFGGL